MICKRNAGKRVLSIAFHLLIVKDFVHDARYNRLNTSLPMSALVRSSPFGELFFISRRLNIASGIDPASGPVMEGFRNFRQQCSGAAFSPRQMGARCTFVRQTAFCPTKVLALRGWGRSQVAPLFQAIYGYQPKTDRQDRQEASNAEL